MSGYALRANPTYDALAAPPPVTKAGLQAFVTYEGGGSECHEFSSPISERSAKATGELSSMAFQVGV